jgi:HAD superfamily hydrolase (TIGR01549 family)
MILWQGMRDDIKHIWFDFAGTLFVETPEFHEAHRKLLYQTYANLKGIDDLKVAEKKFIELQKKYGSNSAVFRALGQPSDYWMKALDSLDFATLLKPNLEIPQTLAVIKDNVLISLFTNYVKYRIDMLLQLLQIPSEYFTHIITGDDVAERKPSLEGFHAMIERSGIPASQLLYVGDRVAVDIKPAKQVGMKTCLVYAESDEANYCFKAFKDLTELIALDQVHLP